MDQQTKGSKMYLVGITLVAVLGGLLFGYDTAVISGAQEALRLFFEQAQDFEYTKLMHGITSSSALIGCVIGGAISGILANKYGRRNSLMIASILFFLSALGSYNPEFLFFQHGEPTVSLLIAFNLYRILGGIGVGLASAVCPMYIAELAPSKIRGTLVSCNQFAIIFGMLVVYFVNYMIMRSLPNQEILFAGSNEVCQSMVDFGWRLMFLSEAVPAALFGLLLICVPKTPRFLVMVGQETKALSILERINGCSEAKGILNDIKETTKEKNQPLLTFGVAVVAIGILLSIFQQAVGINAVLYYAPEIFKKMGASGDSAMMQTVVMGIVNIIFTAVAIFTVDRLGRKPLLIIGSLGMMFGAVALGVLTMCGLEFSSTALIFIIIYTASFMMSWGPICWVLISEIFPNTIRGKAVAIAVAAQWIMNFIVSSTFFSLSEWSLAGTYFIYGFSCLASVIFVWKFVPETKGKSLEDMTALWTNRK